MASPPFASLSRRRLCAAGAAMASVVRALRPGGRVVPVEYRAEDPKVPIKSLHRMSEAQVLREMAVHPVVHERTSNVLPWQHILVFRRRD